MKKIFLVLSVVVIAFSSSYAFPKEANASLLSTGAKMVYKVSSETVEARMKAIQARKGVQQLELYEMDGTPTSASKTFSGAMDKALQEAGDDIYKSISGEVLNETPLRNKPGWIKATIGTAAFLTGADIALEIYQAIQSSGMIEWLDQGNVTGGTYSSAQGLVNYKTSSYSGDDYLFIVQVAPGWRFKFDGGSFTTSNYGTTPIDITSEYASSIALFDGSRPSLVLQQNVGDTYYYDLYWTRDGTAYVRTIIMSRLSEGVVTPQIRQSTITPSHFTTKTVPEVDTSKVGQTIIYPDPAVYTTPDAQTEAINENWEMVSSPDVWLGQNPQYDPDATTTPGTDPTTDPTTDPVGEIPSLGGTGGSFFPPIKQAFDTKYPFISDVTGMYDVTVNSCYRWEDIKVSGLNVMGVSFGSLSVVDSSFVNAVGPKIKVWLSGVIWFLLGLYLIRKISVVWGSGRGGGD